MHSPSHPQSQSARIESNNLTFWTFCPNCYFLYEYSGIYKDRCLRCQNCAKPFNTAAVQQPPPGILVPGKDQYYCDVGYFKKGGNLGSRDSFLGDKKGKNKGFQTNLENCVVISDDSDDDCGVEGKKECKNERNCDDVGDVLQRKRKVYYKSVARNTKKKFGRGIRYMGLDL